MALSDFLLTFNLPFRFAFQTDNMLLLTKANSCSQQQRIHFFPAIYLRIDLHSRAVLRNHQYQRSK